MKLGFVGAILPELNLERVLTFAAAERFDCVELMCWPTGKAERRYAGVTHIDVDGLTPDSTARLKEQITRSGVAISGLGYYPNVLSSDATEADVAIIHLKKVIHAAAALNVGVVNTFVGRDPWKSVDANWPRFLEVWPPLVKLAGDLGVRIAIENCPMHFTADEWPGGKNLAISPAIWRRMFADIPAAHFGLNYDPSHFVWQQMDYIKPLREFAGRIFHVHAKDARIDRQKLDDVGIAADPLAFHQPVIPGSGDIDWGRFVNGLAEVGYRGPVCVEVEDRAYEDSLQTRQEALRKSRDFLRRWCA
jgi:sugar phosphate isomerase/epimerase